jgi:FkbM family methyltransferase
MKDIRGSVRKLRARLRAWRGLDEDAFLWRCTGVIHVGANVGHEAQEYEDRGLRVLWIEPISEVFAILKTRISHFPQQSALQALVTDQDGKEYEFHIANNEGGSSSIFDFADHKDIWPDVRFERTIRLQSTTLPNLCAENGVDMRRYDCLIMDTQGSELLVLRGAEPILKQFKFIKTEAADFEAYAGCAKVDAIVAFLRGHGFEEVKRKQFAHKPGGGGYFEILFKRC